MAHGFKHGGTGGASLNFKVVGSTTEPANPKGTVIWVNTDVEITSWIFSTTEPTECTEGMIWFTTGTSSTAPFNALKKNDIEVYPLRAEQYISGAWVRKIAKSYRNDKWVDWLYYLYFNGDECKGITGGWDNNNVTISSGVSVNALSVDRRSDCIVVTQTATSKAGAFTTVNPVDVTNFNTAVFDIDFKEVSTTASWGLVGVHKNKSTPREGASYLPETDWNNNPINVFISELSGPCYFSVGLYSTSYITMRGVWLL